MVILINIVCLCISIFTKDSRFFERKYHDILQTFIIIYIWIYFINRNIFSQQIISHVAHKHEYLCYLYLHAFHNNFSLIFFEKKHGYTMFVDHESGHIHSLKIIFIV